MQGLRGVAVLLVVVFHAGLALPGGFVGVDVFFVISGYVITRLLRRELDAEGSVSFSRFYARRARRLLPLLAVTLTLTAVASFILLSPLGAVRATARTAAAAAAFNANNYLGNQRDGYFDLEPTDNALLHTWSLSVEEQFYLVLPAVLLLAWWVGRRVGRSERASARSLALAVVLGAIASGIVAIVTGAGGADDAVAALRFTRPEAFRFYAAPARAWEFLVGALVACSEARLASLPRRVLEVLGAAGALLVAYGASTSDDTGSFASSQAAFAVAGAALLLLPGLRPVPTGAGRRIGVAAVLSARPLTWLGDRSYGWYLVHWPLIVFTAMLDTGRTALAAAAVASLGLAAVAHRRIEDRFRYDERIRGRRAVVLTMVCVVAPLVVGLGVSSADARYRIPALDEANRGHFVYDDECRVADTADIQRCERPARGSTQSVFLIGDSHAAQWGEAVAGAAADLHVDLAIATMPSCPTLPGLVKPSDGETAEACARFTDAAFDTILDARPDVVVLALAGPRYLAPDGWGPDEWGAAVRATVELLGEHGIRTLLVHDNPYPDLPPQRCGRLRHALDGCRSTLELADAAARRGAAFEAERAAVADADLVATFDPMLLLCDAGGCPNTRDGIWLYSDDHHVSVAASEQLAPAFRSALANALVGR